MKIIQKNKNTLFSLMFIPKESFEAHNRAVNTTVPVAINLKENEYYVSSHGKTCKNILW